MRYGLICVSLLAGAAQLPAQLPPDAVDLAKVKISEQEKSIDLCPVHLVASVPSMETWEHEGVSYRGHEPGCKAAFDENPNAFLFAHAELAHLRSIVLENEGAVPPKNDPFDSRFVLAGTRTADGFEWRAYTR